MTKVIILLSLIVRNDFSKCLCLLSTVLQIRYASVDLELHTKYVPGGAESIHDIDQRVGLRTQVIPLLPEDRFLCSFSHIFAGYLLFCFIIWMFYKYYITSFSKLLLLFYFNCVSDDYEAGYYSYQVLSLFKFMLFFSFFSNLEWSCSLP